MASDNVVHEEYQHATHQPFFFNGRLLYAEDLHADQAAVRERLRRLGRAVGRGVVEGLFVRRAGTDMLRVEHGLAINSLGDCLRLPVNVSFYVSPPKETSRRSVKFASCARPTTASPLGKGAYVLVAWSTTEYRGEIARIGIEHVDAPDTHSAPCPCGCDGDVAKGCGRRWEVEGIAFGLIPIPTDGAGDAKGLRYHNLLAYRCLGHSGAPPGEFLEFADGVEAMPGLQPHHVPLALFQWDVSTIVFLDNWAVRRPSSRPFPGPSWSAFASERTRARGVARFEQFEDQIVQGAPTTGLELNAAQWLRYLPPAGLLPLKSARVKMPSDREERFVTSTARGYTLEKFFGGMRLSTRGIATPEEARLAIERSWWADPIDLDANPVVDVFIVEVPRATAFPALAVGQVVMAAVLSQASPIVQATGEIIDAGPESGSRERYDKARALAAMFDRGSFGESPTNEKADALLGLVTSVFPADHRIVKDIRGKLDVKLRPMVPLEAAEVSSLWALFVRRPRDLFTRPVEEEAEPKATGTGGLYAPPPTTFVISDSALKVLNENVANPVSRALENVLKMLF